MKKSQISLFIIIGLIIILSISVFIYMNSNSKKAVIENKIDDSIGLSTKKQRLERTINICVEQKVDKAIETYGISNTEKDIEIYINKELDSCVNWKLFEDIGTNTIRGGGPNAKITIFDESLIANIDYPITINVQDAEAELSEFNYNLHLSETSDVVQDENGITKKEIRLRSSDENILLIIPEDTKIQDKDHIIFVDEIFETPDGFKEIVKVPKTILVEPVMVDNIKLKLENRDSSFNEVLGEIVYDLSPDGIYFDKAIEIRISYADMNIGSYDETKLRIGYYNEEKNKWEDITKSVDTSSKEIIGETNHFSTFAALKPKTYQQTEHCIQLPEFAGRDPRRSINLVFMGSFYNFEDKSHKDEFFELIYSFLDLDGTNRGIFAFDPLKTYKANFNAYWINTPIPGEIFLDERSYPSKIYEWDEKVGDCVEKEGDEIFFSNENFQENLQEMLNILEYCPINLDHDVGILIVKYDELTFAYADNTITIITLSNKNNPPEIIVHELGHALGDLDDTYPMATIGNPNRIGPICNSPSRDNGCEEWCNGEVKDIVTYKNEVYQSQTRKDDEPFDINYCLNQQTEKDCKCDKDGKRLREECIWMSETDEWGNEFISNDYIDNSYFQTRCIPKEGKVSIIPETSCIGGLGCYQNCFGSNKFRPSKTGEDCMMHNPFSAPGFCYPELFHFENTLKEKIISKGGTPGKIAIDIGGPRVDQYWITQDASGIAKLYKAPLSLGLGVTSTSRMTKIADTADSNFVNPAPRIGVAAFKKTGYGTYMAAVGTTHHDENGDGNIDENDEYQIQWVAITGSSASGGTGWRWEGSGPTVDQYWIKQDASGTAKVYKAPLSLGLEVTNTSRMEVIGAGPYAPNRPLKDDGTPLTKADDPEKGIDFPSFRMGVSAFKATGSGTDMAAVGTTHDDENGDGNIDENDEYKIQWVEVGPGTGWQWE
ncbi:hypothetical protein GF327_02480 [Candidatus Woesearchaeota archaeon]|nr:hypothetical protein [Candidatus Woesearchaeota archaeon]